MRSNIQRLREHGCPHFLRVSRYQDAVANGHVMGHYPLPDSRSSGVAYPLARIVSNPLFRQASGGMADNDAAAVGARIRARYKELGLRQIDVATAVGVQPKDVLRWEKGEWKPSGKRLTKLAKVLETSAEWILDGATPAGQGIVPDLDTLQPALAEFVYTLDAPRWDVVAWVNANVFFKAGTPAKFGEAYRKREASVDAASKG